MRFAHRRREIACIDIEYILRVRRHYGIGVYCYRYPLEPVPSFYHAGRELTIPEAERDDEDPERRQWVSKRSIKTMCLWRDTRTTTDDESE